MPQLRPAKTAPATLAEVAIAASASRAAKLAVDTPERPGADRAAACQHAARSHHRGAGKVAPRLPGVFEALPAELARRERRGQAASNHACRKPGAEAGRNGGRRHGPEERVGRRPREAHRLERNRVEIVEQQEARADPAERHQQPDRARHRQPRGRRAGAQREDRRQQREAQRPDLAAGQDRERRRLAAIDARFPERLAQRRQHSLHRRMGGDREDDQHEEGAEVAAACEHGEA